MEIGKLCSKTGLGSGKLEAEFPTANTRSTIAAPVIGVLRALGPSDCGQPLSAPDFDLWTVPAYDRFALQDDNPALMTPAAQPGEKDSVCLPSVRCHLS